MEGGSQTDPQSFSGSLSEPQSGHKKLLESPCAASDACTDLNAQTGDKMFTNDGHSFGPAMEQQDISTKPLQDSTIHYVPVEILSIIFILVKKAIFAPKFKGPDGIVPTATYKQPSQSPPLLVGAVCKKWRDITLTMPRLWTDIMIGLHKCADGQLAMVNEWALRSSPHPLDISIFFVETNFGDFLSEEDILDEFGGVFSVLRSLAVRWDAIALDVPEVITSALFDNLEENLNVSSLFLPCRYIDPVNPKLQHPFRPRRLISNNISGTEMPLEWDRLVFLELEQADDNEILHIIRHAQNLTHCIAGEEYVYKLPDFPIPTSPITNHSLIYLHTKCHIIGHLTLPSLLHLNYVAADDIDECFDSLSKFLDRSSPPLDNFILRCYVDHLTDPIPRFEMLPGITSLVLTAGFLGRQDVDTTDNFINALTRSFAHPILPHLKAFSLKIARLSGSSSLLFSHLFPDHKQNNRLADIEAMPSTPNDFRRPLSQVRVQLALNVPVVMDKETFLYLSEVRKSGIDLSILDHRSKDVLRDMARVHGVESSYND